MRLFGVGITRARNRLYLIADWAGVAASNAGAFPALRAAVERGEVRRWSAAALLGRGDPAAEPADATFADVARQLRRTVAVTDVGDEHQLVDTLDRHLSEAHSSVWMWSPWIANQARRVVPLIAAAAERGVAVTVFLRPDDDRNIAREWAQRHLPALYAAGATVIRSDHEHRKLIVIDDQWVMIGSANVLSNTPGSTREVMITLVGRAFAERMLTELRVDEIGRLRSCHQCGNPMDVRRGRSRRADPYWQCARCDHREAL